MISFKDKPPTLTINEFVKTTMLDLLKPMGEHISEGTAHDGKPYKETLYKYDLNQLRDFCLNLMYWTMTHYDYSGLETIKERNNLEDFTEEEQQLYLPMAFMLSCIEGNAFPMCVKQYIPDAYKKIKLNGWDIDAVRTMVETVNKSEFKKSP